MKPVLVFDVNETLLDLKALDPIFEDILGDAAIRQQWFSQFIQNTFVSIITDSYQPFGKIGISALEMIASRKGITLKEDDKVKISEGVMHLPAHSEVYDALRELKGAGFRMVTLTNSTTEVGKAQIKNANLEEYFDEILSAGTIKKLKPAKEAYQYAAKELNIELKEMMLIAAHAWDIAGALEAGCMAAFIARPGAVLNPLAKHPHVQGKDLEEVANKIIQLYK